MRWRGKKLYFLYSYVLWTPKMANRFFRPRHKFLKNKILTPMNNIFRFYQEWDSIPGPLKHNANAIASSHHRYNVSKNLSFMLQQNSINQSSNQSSILISHQSHQSHIISYHINQAIKRKIEYWFLNVT